MPTSFYISSFDLMNPLFQKIPLIFDGESESEFVRLVTSPALKENSCSDLADH